MRRWGFRSSEPTTQLNNLWGLFKIPRCWRFLDPTSRLETFICDPCNSSSPAPQVCKSIRSVETLRRYGLNLSVNSSNNVPTTTATTITSTLPQICCCFCCFCCCALLLADFAFCCFLLLLLLDPARATAAATAAVLLLLVLLAVTTCNLKLSSSKAFLLRLDLTLEVRFCRIKPGILLQREVLCKLPPFHSKPCACRLPPQSNPFRARYRTSTCQGPSCER